jgi:hypothetical protein
VVHETHTTPGRERVALDDRRHVGKKAREYVDQASTWPCGDNGPRDGRGEPFSLQAEKRSTYVSALQQVHCVHEGAGAAMRRRRVGISKRSSTIRRHSQAGSSPQHREN